MPRVVDKLIINSNTHFGSSAAIHTQFQTLLALANEIEDAGLGGALENLQFLSDLRSLCSDHDVADRNYLDGLKSVVLEMAAYIDANIQAPPAKTP
jgi:hypothetical protein